eukprot:844152-Pyramimonas_sp.AAC.1
MSLAECHQGCRLEVMAPRQCVAGSLCGHGGAFSRVQHSHCHVLLALEHGMRRRQHRQDQAPSGLSP